MKLIIIILALLVCHSATADEWSAVVGAEHISSVFDGRPFNNNPELSADFLYGGFRYRNNGWVFDALVATSISDIPTSTYCTDNYVWNQPTDGYQTGRLYSSECTSNQLGSNPRAIFRIEKEWTLSK